MINILVIAYTSRNKKCYKEICYLLSLSSWLIGQWQDILASSFYTKPLFHGTWLALVNFQSELHQ